MAENDDTQKDAPPKKTLSLGGGGGGTKTLSLGAGAGANKARQVVAAATTQRNPAAVTSVAVEVRRGRRSPGADAKNPRRKEHPKDKTPTDGLSADERAARERALKQAMEDGEAPRRTALPPRQPTHRVRTPEDSAQDSGDGIVVAPPAPPREGEDPATPDHGRPGAGRPGQASGEERERAKPPPPPRRPTVQRRRGGRITVTQAVSGDYDRDRGPSLAAQRRAREKARLAAAGPKAAAAKVAREVILPETITVQELAARMAEPAPAVIKALMKMGVMATINQAIDADTAELLAGEFGHAVRRVTDADVEAGLEGPQDPEGSLAPRPPVVTVMGHVDHGKTSLLDALRSTNVVAGEAGGITQHIGAYQIALTDGPHAGHKVTFLDTPGHEAFTAMRARGAGVTDIVVVVVAADDSIMPQTLEAISHAKAAEVPIIIAINKIDLPGARPDAIRQDLLRHDVQVEQMGGDVLCVEISAKQRLNLDKLAEAIVLQAEMLELAANPDRTADGIIIESKQERGRGSVATVLVRRGTLRVGDVFIAGAETGKVRALMDDRGQSVPEAAPGQPVEVLGLDGTPESGDSLVVVGDEGRAREVAQYRQRKKREVAAAMALKRRTTLEDLLARKAEGERTTLPVVIKADVHGSIEAVTGSLAKIVEDNPDIDIRVLHAGVGGITESDVTLARASGGLIIGFNVRAGAQARLAASQAGVEIRYYTVIYDIVDEIKAVLAGMLSPALREVPLGTAEVREVFRVSKVGNVAGCMVTDGVVRRGAKLRILRDDVVVHTASIAALKRFKDDAKEVQSGMECGIAIARYDDIKAGDVLEVFDVVEEARTVA
jgi:translation initiation factor IF-2